MQRIIEYLAGFIVLILMQIFIFDNINLLGYVSPTIYIAFIILLPMEIRHSTLMLIGFGTGALMDLLTGSAGLCTMATTFIASIRPIFLTIVAGGDVVNSGGVPSNRTLGTTHFIVYLSLTVLAYTIPVFFLEKMSLTDITHTLLSILLSSIFTVLVIYLCHLPLTRKTNTWQ